jgi:hypothetical protein
MASHTRVLNLTTGLRIKRSQAIGRVAHGISEWVEMDFTVRDLTLAESIAARREQAKRQQPLELSEVHGLTYEPPVYERSRTFAANRRDLLMQARQFVQSQV